ncbi:flagellar biosynthesis protein FlhF [Thalassotalea sp. LPB0316]|uniref:flagellar biosynthesis protein FlhF n=1 Tax=Thalassotalea sp. LPB0316 TaxID=2769490 RepID=UPI00186754D5|nr:flagellar biosynthesis protein FlhF [Thalassotalea sp. LPB0316]QOL27104.1 flagellar biosynthesis protein FlhF [Thalassotalea sp. LPB0316]
MKIKRFVARDMKTALAEIKEVLGADAVIMSNKKIPEGIEIMAAVDYNQQPVAAEPAQTSSAVASADRQIAEDVVSIGVGQSTEQGEAQPSANMPKVPDSLAELLKRDIQKPKHQATDTTETIEQQFKEFTQRLSNAQSQVDEPHLASKPTVDDVDGTEHQHMTDAKAVNTPQNEEFERMKQEMASIRQLLEHQVAGLLWQDRVQKDPNRAVLVNKLSSMGIDEHLADQIAGFIPRQLNEQEAWQQVKHLLANQLQTTNNDIIRQGGVVSLVGPTGVGKTTTIAKIAARFAQIHGADSVALISTDTYRIAGFEQLTTYGKIIGCPVKLAEDAKELDMLLAQFSNKKLVLIDTAGMGQRDMRLNQHLTTLVANTRARIKNYLVLAANTQASVMDENVQRFNKIPLAGCVFTKLDESLSVGEIISTSIQHNLPVGYLTDGQRVPEDIKVANAEKLVTLADKMFTKQRKQAPINWAHQSMASHAVM